MAVLMADCPRCRAERMTFDVGASTHVEKLYGWSNVFEVFAVCRRCFNSTIFVLVQEAAGASKPPEQYDASLDRLFEVRRYISVRDHAAVAPPDFLPADIKAAFEEGAACMAVQCWNAASAMFRLCVDLATQPLLPEAEAEGLNSKVRRDLGLRLPWLLRNKLLPGDLSELSTCVKEDGNDGVHRGTLTKEDAEDLLDFTSALLERLITEPERIKQAAERRRQRRGG